METTNLLTERQPAPITVELWTHAELEAFKLLVSEGLWALDRHDDSVRDVIHEICTKIAPYHEKPKLFEDVGEAFYAFFGRMREFIETREAVTPQPDTRQLRERIAGMPFRDDPVGDMLTVAELDALLERAAQAEALLHEWDEYGLKQIKATEQHLYERTKRFLSAGDKP